MSLSTAIAAGILKRTINATRFIYFLYQVLQIALSPALVNGEYDAQSHKVPSILLQPDSVTTKNMESTVVADKFVDPKELCSGDFAKLCDAAGIK